MTAENSCKLDDVKADDSARCDVKTMMMTSLFLVADPAPLLLAAAKFADLVDENFADLVDEKVEGSRPDNKIQSPRSPRSAPIDEG
jgi:hypothetical protein